MVKDLQDGAELTTTNGDNYIRQKGD